MAMEQTQRLLKGRVDWSKYVTGSLVGLLAAVLVYQGVSEARLSKMVGVGEEAPLVAGLMLDGKAFDFDALRGKSVMVVDFWETTCGPCKKELPSLVNLARTYRDRGVVVVMANNAAGDHPAAVEQYVNELLADRPENVQVVRADIESWDRYRVQGIPTTYFINRSGKIVERFRGYTEEPILRDALERALED